MTTDDKLTDLFARRAEQGSGVRPTMDGVQSAIAQRTRRRHRQRVIGSGIAALCLVAGIAGGFALAGGDEGTPIDATDEPTLPAIPLVGVDVDGLELQSTHGPTTVATGEPVRLVVFTQVDGALDGPALTMAQFDLTDDLPPELFGGGGDPIDLDGDGSQSGPDDGEIGRIGANISVSWTVGDAQLIAVTANGVDEASVLTYVRSLDRDAIALETVPPPEGLLSRQVIDTSSDPAQAYVTYDGLGGSLNVLTLNEPGWFDASRVGSFQPSSTDVIALTSTLLGPGDALLSTDPEFPATTALVRTDSGLTVQVIAQDISPDVVRDIITGDRFVELEPSEDPAVTTLIEPAPTTSIPATAPTTSVVEPVTPTTVGGSTTRITGIHIEPGRELDRLEISFSGVVPDYELTTAPEAVDVDCHDPVSDNGDYLVLRLTAPPGTGLDEWEGTVQISGDPDGAIVGVLSCGWSEDEQAAYLSVELDQLREAETYLVPGLPTLVVDVPRD